MAETRTSTAIWPAVATAVAALTEARTGDYGELTSILGDPVPLEVAEALTTITTALLKGMSPADDGAEFLRGVGLLALAQDAQQDASG